MMFFNKCFCFEKIRSAFPALGIHAILPKLPDKLLSFCNTRKGNTVLNRLRIDHSYLTHSFILRKEEAPVYVACKAVITVKFEEISLYSLFRNVIPEIFYFLREIGVLENMKCVKEMFV